MAPVALIAIIALAAGGLIVVMLAIAHVEHAGDASDATSAPSDALFPSDVLVPSETPEPAARAQKPSRRSAWRGIPQAWTSWRHRHADQLPYPRARRRWRALNEEGAAGWVAATVVLSVVLGYVIVHL